MAYASNYKNVYAPASPTYYYVIEVAVREESTSVDTNKSRLYLEADITGKGIGFDGSDDQYLEVYWVDSKNGEILGATTTYKKCVQDKLYQITGYIDVPHNDDGTLSGYAYTSWGKNGTNRYVPPSTTVTANLTLTTIPRKSTATITGTPNIGSQITINTNRKSTSFKHTLSYSFGNLSGQIATNVGDSTNWTIPTTFYAQIPNATSGTMTLTCTTYNGGVSVGSTTTNVTVYVNTSSAKTTLNTPTFTIDSTTNSKTGVTNKYINNYSTISVTCTATNSYSSPIKTISLIGVKSGAETIIETKTYSSTATSQTATFSNKTKLNYDSLRVRATDTRNISSNNASVGITTIAYVPITSDSSPTIVRTTQTGSQAKITSFKGNFWQGSFGSVTNALTIQWRYRVSGGSYSSLYTIPAGSITKSGSTYTISNYTFTNGSTSDLFTYTSLYDIEFTVKDSLQTAPLVTYRLSRGVPNFVIFQSKSQLNGLDLAVGGPPLSGGSGTAGYMYLCDISTTGTYQNQDMSFDIKQRNRQGTIFIRLTSGGTAGVISVNSLTKVGNINVYYIVANNVLKIYVQKSEAYDSMQIFNLQKGDYMKSTSINWVNQTVTSLPSGYSTAGNNGNVNNIYSLPTASTSTKGGIKVGNNLTISNEVLSMSPTNLYYNANGSNSSVTLSQSAANFNYLEIFYRVNTLYTSIKVYSPNSKSVGLFGVTNENTVMQIGSATATISGTTITISNAQMANIPNGSVPANWNASNIYIVRVDGYK